MQDMADPSLSVDRARQFWQHHGRSQKWIQQRMMGQETRNKLTDYWKDHEIKKEEEFAILTNIIHQEWSDVTVNEHKKIKGLKTQNQRDHMSEAELIFTALAELSTRQISESVNATGKLTEGSMAKKQKITESPLKGEIILYHAPDGKAALDVRLEDNSLWLTQKQISELFDTERSVITKHFGNIFRSGELDKNSVCAKFAHTAGEAADCLP